jgi:hypothetical protein
MSESVSRVTLPIQSTSLFRGCPAPILRRVCLGQELSERFDLSFTWETLYRLRNGPTAFENESFKQSDARS